MYSVVYRLFYDPQSYPVWGAVDKLQACWSPCLHFKDVCKRDMKQAGIDLNSWEKAANDSSVWRQIVAAGTRHAEARRGAPPYCRRRDRRGNCEQQPSFLCQAPLLSYEPTAEETATPEWGCTATIAAATRTDDLSGAIHRQH